jgi:hypothetical protein
MQNTKLANANIGILCSLSYIPLASYLQVLPD